MLTYTEDEILKLCDDPASRDTMRRWLDRGDGIAVYEHSVLGDPNAGHLQFTSYGSAEAQLEMDTPPQRMPDIGSAINWRYQLKGVFRRG